MRLHVEGEEFENVYVFVADALRFDYVPERARERGEVVKTAASGTASPTSFATMVTGRYPPQHGVYDFSCRLDDSIPTLYDAFDGVSVPSTIGGNVGGVLGTGVDSGEGSVSDAEPPFVFVERNLLTHAAYGELFQWDDAEFDSHEEYWNARKNDREGMLSDYERGARMAFEVFEERLDTLEDRGLLDDTLAIFTADHGDLLGEYGLVAHGLLSCPELVYVPTVFANDRVTARGEFVAQVDFFPTAASVFGEAEDYADELPGYDLLAGAPDHRLVYNRLKRRARDKFSAWDASGGHVFQRDSPVDRCSGGGER
ncbi:hypothetical protein BRD00_13145 [Halobacteriales archaeon QS_8_69_26]|nr:MAG: hypothetical protein BRD00_13145 [Halobacteriales archaeon QS_8_69_26]